MGLSTNYVWYASYGSNLSRERFLCYIKGGRPRGSQKVEVGCKDPSLPIDEATYMMNYPLYFAKRSERWQNQGVAFIGLSKDERVHTYSRKYLITAEQFIDVVKQENNGATIEIDLEEVILNRFKTFRDSWYGTILYVGEEQGYPILTFTADWDLDVPFVKPSKEYVSMIIHGLKTTLSLDDSEIVDYLLKKPGINGVYTHDELEEIVRGVE
ncbi:hypothetical protein [Halalkalibacter hemicellulosilyticus]|uniref:Histone deacetylase n=1 Tax=Halalkalibacter hemicellulosilyticusJCM 9152 TaxID=1236971 RepID=W4QDM7_9BACI|nr:hypothetical protein [Halalkalibacter hemicellulosilyticus]GAE29444.1 hypothetical protein JCM9152_802 [Halalkalibacter hemicellulosilyticusJCM 9152]